MGFSEESNEIIYFMDKSREVAPIPEGVDAQLEVIEEKSKFKITSSRTIIGRGEADLQIQDPKISEEHAAIGYIDGIFFILDIKSKNGTFVNGEKIIEKVLHDGDEIRLGLKPLRFNVKGKLHEEATGRWDKSRVSVPKILEMIIDKKGSGKFDDPTRIIMDGETKHTHKASLRHIFFEVTGGTDKGKKFNFLQKEIVLGRSRGDLPVKDPDVSKNHAEIVLYDSDQIFIRDLGSTNGTFVGEEKVDRKQLKNGDIITLGSTTLEIIFGEVVTHPYQQKSFSDEKTADDAKGKKVYVVEVTGGRDKGKKIKIGKGSHIIGRETGAIALKDLDVSRSHAKIKVDDKGKAKLMDLSSTNGTYLNGKKVKSSELNEGDEILVGNTVLKISRIPE